MRTLLLAAALLLTFAAVPATAQEPPSPLPCAPTGVTVEPLGLVIHVTWNETLGATGYTVYRAQGDGNFTAVAMFGAEQLELHDTGVEPDVTYRYYVTATVAGVETAPCAVHEVTSNDICPIQVSARVFRGDVLLSWTALAASDNYTVYRAEGNGSMELLATVSPSTQSYVDTDVEAGATYSYRVLYVIDGEERPHCNPDATVTVPSEVPFFPSALAFGLAAVGALVGVALLRRRA